MAMARRNIVAAIVLLAFSACYVWLAVDLPERHVPNTPGPSFFPLVIISLLSVLSLSLLFSGISGIRAAERTDGPQGLTILGAVTLAAFFCYLALLPIVGFVIASVVFFAVMMVLYGSRRPIAIVAASVLIPLALFVVFRFGFQIILPRGAWGF